MFGVDWTALGTWALVLATCWFMRSQLAEAKRATGLQLFAQLVQDYQRPEMRNLRRTFALQCKLAGGKSGVSLVCATDETVLEFFENLAHLTLDKVLEEKVVWSYFSVAVEGYWHASQSMIEELRQREGDDKLYERMEALSNRFAALTEGARGKGIYFSTADRVQAYLDSEAALA